MYNSCFVNFMCFSLYLDILIACCCSGSHTFSPFSMRIGNYYGSVAPENIHLFKSKAYSSKNIEQLLTATGKPPLTTYFDKSRPFNILLSYRAPGSTRYVCGCVVVCMCVMKCVGMGCVVCEMCVCVM